MDYITLQVKTPQRGPVYERRLNTEEVFGAIVGDFATSMLRAGLFREGQEYWALVTPEYRKQLRFENLVIENSPAAEADSRNRPGWLTLEHPNGGFPHAPMAHFTVELNTEDPEFKSYRKSFPLDDIAVVSENVLTSVRKAGLLGNDEPAQVEFRACSGSAPTSTREVIYSLPAELEDLDITVTQIQTEENFPAKSPPAGPGIAPALSGAPVQIFVQQPLVERLRKYIVRYGSTTREIGGVLVGDVYCYPGRENMWIDVEDFIPAEGTEADAISLRFTHRTWQQIQAEKNARFDQSKQIVGWYHTHPAALGILVNKTQLLTTHFFSSADVSVHRQAFGEPWQVAMVTDARCAAIAFFVWDRDSVIQSKYHVLG